jgi:hypothetical protein
MQQHLQPISIALHFTRSAAGGNSTRFTQDARRVIALVADQQDAFERQLETLRGVDCTELVARLLVGAYGVLALTGRSAAADGQQQSHVAGVQDQRRAYDIAVVGVACCAASSDLNTIMTLYEDQ